MNVLVAGGGPGGLYAALLLKKADPRRSVRVLERNEPGVTYGWGVVFSDQALERLQQADLESHRAIVGGFARWADYDKNQPRAVVFCQDAQDVAHAVRWARQNSVPVVGKSDVGTNPVSLMPSALIPLIRIDAKVATVVSSAVVTVCDCATGASFTGFTVMLTVAGAEFNWPSFALNVKLSGPL